MDQFKRGEDMASLNQDSVKPLQASLDTLRETVSLFQHWLASTEVMVRENFERLVAAEATIKSFEGSKLISSGPNWRSWKQIQMV